MDNHEKKDWLPMKITRKKFLTGLAILCVLAVAFFWGGDFAAKKTLPENPAQGTVSAASAVKASREAERALEKEADTSAEAPQKPETETAAKPENTENPAASPEPGKATGKAVDKSGEDPSAVEQEKARNVTSAQVIDSKTGKDRYMTDPIPPGRPAPVEWQNVSVNGDKKLTCTLSVTCKTILDHMDRFNKNKLEVLPKDGVIYAARKVVFYEGESVFNVLQREMKKNKIHMEFEMTPIYNSNYIEGIHNIYEFDCGELSGWMYKVNGWFPNYGCSRYMLKDGDVVKWIYTCDLGRDLGEKWLGGTGG